MPAVVFGQSYEAQIDWARRVELGLAVSGKIEQVAVETGDQVKAGDEMLRLDPTPFESEVAQAKARLSKAEAELKEAERALGRSRELYDRGVLATVPLQHSELNVTQARSELQSAQAALKHAQYRLGASRLLAPFDAWVIRRNAVEGQVVASELQSPVLLTIGEANNYIARAQVDVETARGLKKGQASSVQLGGQEYSGTIRSVALEPNAQSRFAVEVVFTSETRPQIGSGAQLRLR